VVVTFCTFKKREADMTILSVMYLDDVSVNESVDDVLHNLEVIKKATFLGLTLNISKCDI